MKLTKKEILEFQQNSDPYLMIDEATEIVPGKRAKGFKLLKGVDMNGFSKFTGQMIRICPVCCK